MIQGKITRKYFIYNPDSGNCISDKLYTENYSSQNKLKKDLSMFQILKPQVKVGELRIDKATRRILRQEPEYVTGVKYDAQRG